MSYELLIQHGDLLILPPVVDGVTIEWERQGQPGKLTFEVLKTDDLEFEEGDPCRFSVDGEPLFYGFIFDKSRKGSAPSVISVTVYDQLYYLKNKDTYVYSDKTATEVIRMIAEDFELNLGELEDTAYKIESRIEENTELFDIIQNALDATMKAKTKLYTLYDKAGRVMLTELKNMVVPLVISKDTASDFEYKSSISTDTYNRIKLLYEDTETGARQVYIAQDSSNIARWGVLQYYEKLSDVTNAKSMADALLELYNEKTRTLKISNALGDVRVRAGTLLIVMLELGDISVSSYLMVEQVKHSFSNGVHLMELKVRGGKFVT